MKNTRLILGVVSVLVVLAFTLSYAEEEVAWEIKGWQTNEGTLIGQAGDMFIGGGVTRGLVDSIPFGKMTYECREIWQASEAGVEFTDLCTLVDSNGDKVLITTTGTLQAWDLKFLAGTGK